MALSRTASWHGGWKSHANAKPLPDIKGFQASFKLDGMASRQTRFGLKAVDVPTKLKFMERERLERKLQQQLMQLPPLLQPFGPLAKEFVFEHCAGTSDARLQTERCWSLRLRPDGRFALGFRRHEEGTIVECVEYHGYFTVLPRPEEADPILVPVRLQSVFMHYGVSSFVTVPTAQHAPDAQETKRAFQGTVSAGFDPELVQLDQYPDRGWRNQRRFAHGDDGVLTMKRSRGTHQPQLPASHPTYAGLGLPFGSQMHQAAPESAPSRLPVTHTKASGLYKAWSTGRIRGSSTFTRDSATFTSFRAVAQR